MLESGIVGGDQLKRPLLINGKRSSAPRLLVGMGALVLFASTAAMWVDTSATAAGSQYQIPTGISCENARIVLATTRVWSSIPNQPEHVALMHGIQRWNGADWINYQTYTSYWTWNRFGQSVSAQPNWYVNNYMHLPVQHQGYYRVLTFVAGTAGWNSGWQYVGGPNHYCYMP